MKYIIKVMSLCLFTLILAFPFFANAVNTLSSGTVNYTPTGSTIGLNLTWSITQNAQTGMYTYYYSIPDTTYNGEIYTALQANSSLTAANLAANVFNIRLLDAPPPNNFLIDSSALISSIPGYNSLLVTSGQPQDVTVGLFVRRWNLVFDTKIAPVFGSAQVYGGTCNNTGCSNSFFYTQNLTGVATLGVITPEPSTWAVLGGGLAIIGLVMRKRAYNSSDRIL